MHHPLELPAWTDKRQGGAGAGRRVHCRRKSQRSGAVNAFILAEVFEEAGLPAGVFNLVMGTGPVVGEALASHPLVDMVSFTGSTLRRQAGHGTCGEQR